MREHNCNGYIYYCDTPIAANDHVSTHLHACLCIAAHLEKLIRETQDYLSTRAEDPEWLHVVHSKRYLTYHITSHSSSLTMRLL